jgi:hypothetical protein
MEIYRDSSQQLPTKIYVNRSLTDATASPAPSVSLKLNGVALSAHMVTKESTGVYVTQLKFSDTFEEGELEATWSFIVNGESITRTEIHTVVTPYVDIDSLYELPYTDQEVRMAEKYARNQINTFTGQKFGKHKSWVKAQGNGTDTLILPERIISPTHIYENEVLVWEEGETDNSIELLEFALKILDREDPIESMTTGTLYRGGRFVEGYTYEVMGDFGYTHVPDDILYCGNMLVDDYFCKDKAWRTKYAQKINSGDFSVDLNSRVFSGTGNSIVDAILSDYMWHRMVVI